MNINKLKKFEGSVSQHEFIQGLIMARAETTTPGHVWERNVHCTNCLFAKSCAMITEELLPDQATCHNIINLLLGEIKVEDLK
jgi:hypothetical protein